MQPSLALRGQLDHTWAVTSNPTWYPLALLVGVTACSFESANIPNTTNDAKTLADAPITDGPIVDATMVDARGGDPDAAPLRRTKNDLIVRYDFNEAAGSTVIRDVSGLVPAADLTLAQGTIALSGTSLRTNTNAALVDFSSTNLAGQRITSACKNSNALTVEAWIKPDNVNTTSRFISLNSENSLEINNFFMLNGSVPGGNTRVQGTVRVTQATPFGIGVSDNNGVVPQTKQFVAMRYGNGVFTLDVIRNNVLTLHRTQTAPGDFASWSDQFKLVVLNSSRYDDSRDTRPFVGEIYSLAVYCRALTDDEVALDAQLGSESP